MIEALIVGFVTGWLISMPIGPINATAISRTLEHGFKYGYAVGIGAAIMDWIYCAGSAQIHQFLSQSPLVNLIFQSVGFVLLVWLGARLLRKNRENKPFVTDEQIHHREEVAEHQLERLHVTESSLIGSFMIGIVLYASNVAGVPEWIFISGFWRENGILKDGFGFNLIFATGAACGTAGWFFTLVRFFSKRREGLKPNTIYIINRVSAYAMLAFGLYFGFQILYGTNWQRVNMRVQQKVTDSLGSLTSSISPPAADHRSVYLPRFSGRS